MKDNIIDEAIYTALDEISKKYNIAINYNNLNWNYNEEI